MIDEAQLRLRGIVVIAVSGSMSDAFGSHLSEDARTDS